MASNNDYKNWAARQASMHLLRSVVWYNPMTWSNQNRFNQRAGDIYFELATAPDGTFDKRRYKCMNAETSETMRRGHYCIEALKACE